MIFDKKIVLVSGASRGLGKSIAQYFMKKGATVIGTSTSNEGVIHIRETLGSQCYGMKLDVTKKNEIEELSSWMKSNIGLPDILVNNAGKTKDNLFIRMKHDDWYNIIETNLNSMFMMSQFFLGKMLKQKWGRIINISSIVGFTGNKGQTNYCASKSGVVGFSKSLALELASRNITVNVVAPGFIKTDMTDTLSDNQKEAIINQIPAKKIGTPDDISEVVLFLATDKSQYITGQTIHVNGGMYLT